MILGEDQSMYLNILGKTRGGPVGELKHDFGLVLPLWEDQWKKHPADRFSNKKMGVNFFSPKKSGGGVRGRFGQRPNSFIFASSHCSIQAYVYFVLEGPLAIELGAVQAICLDKFRLRQKWTPPRRQTVMGKIRVSWQPTPVDPE